MAYTLRCTTAWCSHKRRNWCSQDDVNCKDREVQIDDYSAKEIRKGEPRKWPKRNK